MDVPKMATNLKFEHNSMINNTSLLVTKTAPTPLKTTE